MLRDLLAKIQSELKVPKDLHNSFGGYDYRSCESILDKVKPLLKENGLVLIIQDEMVNLGNRYYVKAIATISDSKESISVTAYAREAENRKGMDDSQITGATSSYARKYALNGMFLIDDTKDADHSDNTKKEEPIKETKKPETKLVDDIIHISTLSNYTIGDVVKEVNAIIVGKEDKKTKTGKDITHLSANGITIALWGKQDHIKVGNNVIFHGVKVAEYNKQKQYSAQAVTIEETIPVDKNGNVILLGE